jgi:hypothetical protein
MREVPLSTKSVGSILEERTQFLVPSYQRGYRWETAQVLALLNDLWEWDLERRDDEGSFYCLQPLVVVKRPEAWEVVDGQQRLTTIFLILRALNLTLPLFGLRYERHPRTPDGLEGLLRIPATANPATLSPDLHFMRQAQEAIGQWRDQHPDASLPGLIRSSGQCVKFIWQEVEQREQAIPVFARLNAGKIRLIDSELIRALFLRRAGEGENEARFQIAMRWDCMERRLREPEFWGFLRRPGEAPESRIEFLLELLAGTPETHSDDKRQVFEFFVERLARNDRRARDRLWQKVEDSSRRWKSGTKIAACSISSAFSWRWSPAAFPGCWRTSGTNQNRTSASTSNGRFGSRCCMVSLPQRAFPVFWMAWYTAAEESSRCSYA